MTETPQARPALLTINAVLSILIGAAGTLLLGYNLLWFGYGLLVDLAFAGLFTYMAFVFLVGSLLLALTILRWGLAVINARSTIAYLPGRTTRVGRYGRVTGVLTVLTMSPVVFVTFFAFAYSDDPILGLFVLACLLAVATAVGMIAFASRIDRGSKA
jgi:hypothetical protein